MPLFFYRARDTGNTPQEGTIDALSLQNARDLLKSKGLFVEEIHEATMKDQGIKKTFLTAEAGEASRAPYYPLIDTLRLYAGWLLAWYGLIFAMGAYQHRGVLPFESQLVAGLAASPVVLATAGGVFLFLMLSSIHKAIPGGILKGLLLSFIGVVAEIWFVVNI